MTTYIRSCKKCKKQVEVKSKSATVVLCDECKPFLKQGFFDDDKMVHCRICGFRARKLTAHIKLKHNGVENYLNQYNDAPLLSNDCKLSLKKNEKTKEKMSKSAFDKWGTEPKEKFEKGYGKRHCYYCHNEYVVKLQFGGKYKCDHCIDKEKQKLYDEKLSLTDFVICPLCLKETKNEVLSRIGFIGYSHLLTHNYTTEQFKKEFPNYKMKAQNICNQHSKALTGEKHFNWGKGCNHKKEKPNKIKIACTHCNKKSIINVNGLCSKCSKIDFGFHDDKEKVFCRICGKRFKSLMSHINHAHQITVEEYLKIYPNAVLSADDTCDKISKTRIELYKETKDDHHFTLIPLIGYKNTNFRGPNWNRQKARALNRDGHKCTMCNKTGNLHVHHKIPFNFFDDYEKANVLENLQTLCRSHHAQEEAKIWKKLKEQGVIEYFDDRIEITYESRVIIQYINKEKIKEMELLKNTMWQDTDDYIYCRVCGKKLRVLTQSHLSTHLMTCEDYRTLYSDAPFISKNASNLNKKSNTKKFMDLHDAIKAYGRITNFVDDSENSVTCKICGFKSDFIVGHIARKHYLKMNVYKLLFPNSRMQSKNYSKRIALKQSVTKQDKRLKRLMP